MFYTVREIINSIIKLGTPNVELSNADWARIKSREDYLKRMRRVGRGIAKRAFEGRLGLRGRTLSGASLMAQQNMFKHR